MYMDDYVNLNHNKTSVEHITTLKGSFNQVYIGKSNHIEI